MTTDNAQSQASQALAAGFLAAFYGPDMHGAIIEYAADNIEWTIPASLGGARRTWNGVEAVSGFAAKIAQLFEPGSMEIRIVSCLAVGEDVALEAAVSGRTVAGVSYGNEYAFFINCHCGRIAAVTEYTDSARVVAALGLGG